jgi:hypothetical protein
MNLLRPSDVLQGDFTSLRFFFAKIGVTEREAILRQIRTGAQFPSGLTNRKWLADLQM